MNIEFVENIFDIVDVLSISISLFLGLLFLTIKSKNKRGNIFLGLFLISLSNEVASSLFEDDFDFFSTAFLTIQLLFFYIIFTIKLKFKPIYLLFILIPILSVFIDIIPLFFYFGFIIFQLIYTLQVLKKQKRKISFYYSDLNNKTLSWIKTIIYIQIFFYSFWLLEEFFSIRHEFITQYFASVSSVLTLIMIYWIGYNGFSQPEIFNVVINNNNHPKIDQSNSLKNQIEIDSEDHEKFLRLVKIIKEKKIFLQRELTIQNLAEQLDVEVKELSKMIKNQAKTNFYHFINQFRVEEFKNLLSTPKANKLSLLGLAKESGFSSKSTFYATFKSYEGITPKQYQTQLKKSE